MHQNVGAAQGAAALVTAGWLRWSHAMSRCRSKTFYLAPRVYKKFSDHLVFAYVGDTVRRVTHRNDIKKLEADPSWDGFIHVGPKHMSFKAVTEGDLGYHHVETWKTDSRLIEGKRPTDASWTFHKVAFQTTSGLGGSKEVVRAALPQLGPGAVAAVAALCDSTTQGTTQAQLLHLVAAAHPVIGDSGIEALAYRISGSVPSVAMLRFGGLRSLDLEALSRYPRQRQVRLIADLWTRAARGAVGDAWDRLNFKRTPVPEEFLKVIQRTAPDLNAAGLADMLDYEVAHFSDTPLSADLLGRIAEKRPDKLAGLALHHNASMELMEKWLGDEDPNRVWQNLADIGFGPEVPSVTIRPDQAKYLADKLSTVPIKRPRNAQHANNALALTSCVLPHFPEMSSTFVQAWAAVHRAFVPSRDDYEISYVTRVTLSRLVGADVQFSESELAEMWRAVREGDRRVEQYSAKLPEDESSRYRRLSRSHRDCYMEFFSNQKACPASIVKTLQEDSANSSALWIERPGRPGSKVLLDTAFNEGFAEQDPNVRAQWGISMMETFAEAASRTRDSSQPRTLGTYTSYEIGAMVFSKGAPDQRKRYELLNSVVEASTAPAIRHPRLGYLVQPKPVLNGSVAIWSAFDVISRPEYANRWLTDSERKEIADAVEAAGVGLQSELEGFFAASSSMEVRKVVFDAVAARSVDPDIWMVGHMWGLEPGPTEMTSSLVEDAGAVRVADADDRSKWPDKPKTWNELPKGRVVKFEHPQDTLDIVDAGPITVAGVPLDIATFDDSGALALNGDVDMHNCTKGYGKAIQEGRSKLFKLSDPVTGKTLYNAELGWEGGLWYVREVKGPYNAGLPDKELYEISSALMSRLPVSKRVKEWRNI